MNANAAAVAAAMHTKCIVLLFYDSHDKYRSCLLCREHRFSDPRECRCPQCYEFSSHQVSLRSPTHAMQHNVLSSTFCDSCQHPRPKQRSANSEHYTVKSKSLQPACEAAKGDSDQLPRQRRELCSVHALLGTALGAELLEGVKPGLSLRVTNSLKP